jgi:hypothetical protein
MNNSSHNDAVLNALAEQVACYRQLGKLADSQHHFVQQSQTEQLLGVLNKRQEVLDRITTLEVTVAPARKDWASYLDTLTNADRATAEELLGETRTLLEEIMSADRNDTIVLQQRQIEITRQIGQAGIGRQANRRYAAAAYGAANRSTLDVRSS